ncbi:YdcH family protein [Candidatus Odyssella thessalonicensis]|uniref:YdcH family protein n=1 Tax=Candidatus Odyssella thessalonicensis TaxID=84647 RepID=UPI000225A90E|nr:DUF465 domain-containing protein [Candidatus Odyssella thessalonicensis]
MGVDPETFVALHHKLDSLKKKHMELESKIESLLQETGHDNLAVHRLKREKLALKDQMAKIEAMMVPDIIA